MSNKMNTNNLARIFSEIQGKRALVIGDVIVDNYLNGEVNRISPEAPVPVIHIKYKQTRLGGAANVAASLVNLGLHTMLCGVIGQDEQGKNLVSQAQAMGMDTQLMLTTPHRVTTVKTRVLAKSQHMLRIDEEENIILQPSETDNLLQSISKHLPHLDIIILEDYDKGCLTQAFIEEIIVQAKAHGVLVAADPKYNNFNYYKGVDLFTPNFEEFTKGYPHQAKKEDSVPLQEIAKKFCEHWSINTLLLTLSEKGILCANENDVIHLPTQVRQVADVSGAGDAVISIASCCKLLQMDRELMVNLSNLAGSLACEYMGVKPIDKQLMLQRVAK